MPLPIVLGIALLQGTILHVLHRLAEGAWGAWSELPFLLPAYAFVVGMPLTVYLLNARLPVRTLASRLVVVGVALVATGAYVGWVNGPVGDLRPVSGGSVLLFGGLTLVAWFVALPFLRLGVRGCFSAEGYVGLFDEAWRLAITLGFAGLFVGLFWALLGLFVGLFESLDIGWPKDVVTRRYFYYPATCAAASFAIGLTDVRPEMFRGLRHLLLGVLRWLSVLSAAIVLLFVGAVALEGVEVLWKTRFATAALISLSLALITLYNTVYQDGSGPEGLPVALAWLVRASLVVGPTLAALAFWALALRLGQHGLSEDRLHAFLVVTVLAGYLVGYCVVALFGARAPFEVRHVNVTMALVTVAALLAVHSPALDFKRVAVRSQVARAADAGDRFDFGYLRHEVGRHGILALRALSATGASDVAEKARRALAELNRRDYSPIARAQDPAEDRRRLRSRLEVYPRGRPLPDGLAERLLAVLERSRWQLACVDRGSPCAALLVDLDGDGREEAVVLSSGQATVYASGEGGWTQVGRLMSWRYQDPDALRRALAEGRWHPSSRARYLGLEIDTQSYAFVPDACESGDAGCP